MSGRKQWTTEDLERLVVGKMTTVTVPVGWKVKVGQRVLDLSEVERLLREARIIAQQECDCRKQLGNCDSPRDGCLCLDEEAEEMMEKGGAREIGLEEAMDALVRSNEAGLVHMAYTFTGHQKPDVICSCCSCCCVTLAAALKEGYPGLIFHSKLLAEDAEGCVHCGACVPVCNFGAREMKEKEMVYTPEKCFGCGLCVARCPGNIISMVEREEHEAS